MARPTKFMPGETVESVGEAVTLMMEQGRWLYFRHKPYHPGFLMSWPVRQLHGSVRRGWIRRAGLNPEHPTTQKETEHE